MDDKISLGGIDAKMISSMKELMVEFFDSLESDTDRYNKRAAAASRKFAVEESRERLELAREEHQQKLAMIDSEIRAKEKMIADLEKKAEPFRGRDIERFNAAMEAVNSEREAYEKLIADKKQLLSDFSSYESTCIELNKKGRIDALNAEDKVFKARMKTASVLEKDAEIQEQITGASRRIAKIEEERTTREKQKQALSAESRRLTYAIKKAEEEGNTTLADRLKLDKQAVREKINGLNEENKIADKEKEKLEEQKKGAQELRAINDESLKVMADRGNDKAAEILRNRIKEDIKTYEKSIDELESQRAEAFTQYLEAMENGEDTSSILSRLEALDESISETEKSLKDAKKNDRQAGRDKADRESSKKIEDGTLLQDYLDKVNDGLNASREADNLKAQQLKAFFTDAKARDLMMQKALADFAKKIDESVDSFYQYQASIEARVQGSDTSFNDMTKTVRRMVSFSPFFKQSDVIDKIKEAVDAGIAYNVELRAFMQVAKDSIATTFEAFDSNLMRIIRLQQADSTAARLGMEASLTKLFNNYFSDTSYLKDAFDTVSQNLIDATAMLPRDMAAEFEFVVQKWLGAMYSVGVSSNTVGMIAQGLNYLGTGNISALNGNDALQTLMAMSATRAGLNYEDMLLNGINAQQTNNLLKSMVEYLQSISENTSNKVTKSAYAEVLGVSTTDLVALNNLLGSSEMGNTGIMEKLYSEAMTYASMEKEVDKQMSQQFKRHHVSTWVSNIIENATTAAASGIGSNIVTYGLWKTLGIIEGLTGGIHIPAFSVMGNMVDLSTFTIEGIAKAGIAGLGLMGSLLGGLGSLAAALSGEGWKAWGYADTNKRGSSFGGITGGIQEGFSESENLNTNMSSDGDEVEKTSMSDKADEGEDTKEVTGKNMEDENKEAEEVPKGVEAIRGHTDTMVTSLASMMEVLTGIQSLLAYDRLFITSDIKEMVGSNAATVHLTGNSLTYKLTSSGGDSETAIDVTEMLFGGQSNNSSTANSLLESIMNSILMNESLAISNMMFGTSRTTNSTGGTVLNQSEQQGNSENIITESSDTLSNNISLIERIASLTEGDVTKAVGNITTLYNSIAKHVVDATNIQGDKITSNGVETSEKTQPSGTVSGGSSEETDEMTQEELIDAIVQRILDATLNVKVTNQGVTEAISVVEIGGI